MSLLQVDKLGVTYPGQSQPALHQVSLSLARDELLVALGPSGCGKSTLLGVLAGFIAPSQGRVLFAGQPVTAPGVERAVVFQHDALLPWLNVHDNVAFGLKLQGADAAARERIVADTLRLVGLADVAGKRTWQLSGGMRQRVGIARALASRSQVLLLDEPFGALDAKVRKELRRWLRRLHDELHVTSIFVTHDQEEALEVADRVVVINQGRIEQEGTPQQVWDNPATPFVYGFLGDVNLFKGRASDGRVYLDDGTQLDSHDAKGASDSKAFAYVRPHDLEVERYSPGQNLDVQGRPTGIVVQLARAIVVGPIARLELIPSESTESTDNAEEGGLIEAQIPAQQFRDMALREGETLVVTPRRAKVFLDEAAGI